jgi:hypothetical protein
MVFGTAVLDAAGAAGAADEAVEVGAAALRAARNGAASGGAEISVPARIVRTDAVGP